MPLSIGTVASHVNYLPPTFSIIPDKTTITEGEIVTYTINTTNYNSSVIYATNSGTANNDDLSPSPAFNRTIPLNNGTATLTLTSLILDDNISESAETIIINLRTGWTGGPIVAVAPTVTLNNKPFSFVYRSSSQSTRTTTNHTNNIPNKDGRLFRLVLNCTSQGGTGRCSLYINGVVVAQRSSRGQTVIYRQLNAGDTISLNTSYTMFNSVISNGSVTANIEAYQEII